MDTLTATNSIPENMRRVWRVRPTAPADFLARMAELNYSPLQAQLLYNRQLVGSEQIERFFEAGYNTLADPFLIKDMSQAVERIKAALATGERIAIYGDFDVDGVTACSLLVQFFRAAGGDVIPRIPHRVDEGYGLNPAALTRLAAQGVRLVITVDCGISNVNEAKLCPELGLDLIITDHHRPPDELPPASAILNVRQPGDTYPYKGLAGVGVAFQMVRALALAGVKAAGLKPNDLLDLVALGTVADIAPLTGENRVLVTAGLKALNKTTRPGILALVEAAGLTPGHLDASSIGFGLAPRLNAAGRIDDAIIAYELLLSDDLEQARELAQELNRKNRERQQKLAAILQEARAQVYAGRLHEKSKLLVLSGADWAAGVVGLVAGRLAEEFSRPVLVLEQGAEFSKGSARSIPQFNVIEALSECDDLLLRYGGHRQAAGFTLETARLDEFTTRLQAIAEARLHPDMLQPALEIDAAITLAEVNAAFKESLQLAPFGSENPPPLFVSYGLHIKEVRPVGAEGAHLRLKLYDPECHRMLEAMAFREGARITELQGLKRLDVVYQLELNEWQGQSSLRMRLHDFRATELSTQDLLTTDH